MSVHPATARTRTRICRRSACGSTSEPATRTCAKRPPRQPSSGRGCSGRVSEPLASTWSSVADLDLLVVSARQEQNVLQRTHRRAPHPSVFDAAMWSGATSIDTVSSGDPSGSIATTIPTDRRLSSPRSDRQGRGLRPSPRHYPDMRGMRTRRCVGADVGSGTRRSRNCQTA